VLRYLFSNLIDEEIRRDEAYRKDLISEKKQSMQRTNAPGSIELPQAGPEGWKPEDAGPSSVSTLKANGTSRPMVTPGLAIGVATPSGPPPLPTSHTNQLSPTAEEGGQLEKTLSTQSPPRTSTDKGGDYFSSNPQAHPATTPGGTVASKTSTDGQEEAPPLSPDGERETQTKEGKGTFGSKFRMTFGMKKLGKNQTADKPAPIEEKSTEVDSDSQSSKTDDRVVEENFLGVIQKMRHVYDDQVRDGAQSVTTAINPSLPSETPVLKPPLTTTILIQEESQDSGGVADLFEGTVGTLGQQADVIEKVAPMWLGEVLLRVRYIIPTTEIDRMLMLRRTPFLPKKS
jgi:WD repeat-containing protein 48